MDSNIYEQLTAKIIVKGVAEPSIPRLLLITRDRLDSLDEHISYLEDRLLPVLEQLPSPHGKDQCDRTSENCDLSCNIASIVESVEAMANRVVSIKSRLQL